jgi:FkbM family methyltransferase
MAVFINSGAVVGRIKDLIKSRRYKRDGIIAKSLMQKFLPPNPFIIEAGAHVGVDTAEMSRRWPNSVIHAFEPVEPLYAHLTQRVSRCRNVQCHRLALGAKAGRLAMYISGGVSDGSSSLLRPALHIVDHPDTTFDQTEEVDVVTLDGWCKAHGVGQVDFLWLDLQGGEFPALLSGELCLRNVRLIHCEVR